MRRAAFLREGCKLHDALHCDSPMAAYRVVCETILDTWCPSAKVWGNLRSGLLFMQALVGGTIQQITCHWQ